MRLLICSFSKNDKVNLITKQKKTHRHSWLPKGKSREKESSGVWDGHAHTVRFKIDKKEGPICSTWNSAQYSVIT